MDEKYLFYAQPSHTGGRVEDFIFVEHRVPCRGGVNGGRTGTGGENRSYLYAYFNYLFLQPFSFPLPCAEVRLQPCHVLDHPLEL